MKMHQLTLTTFKMKQFGVIYLLSALYLNVVFGEKNCDDLGLNFYRSIGCKESGKENGCPSYDGCQYSQPIGHCTYQGQKIDKGQAVKDVVKDSSCSFGCICTAADGEKGSFLCAQGHCGIDESILFGKSPNCFLRYSLDQCCPNSEPECAEESPATCKVGNEEFKEGKLFSPKDKCITCLCTKDFDGKLDGPNCQPTPCDVEVRHSQDIEKNCAPLYFINPKKSEALCCPVTFVCRK
nr:kielin/chordin-like protein [Onthophagus taurus]